MRRSQFNVRTTYLSEAAYQYVEQLSKNKILSYQFALWAERGLSESEKSTNEELEKVLREIENLKNVLLSRINLPAATTQTVADTNKNIDSEPLELISSSVVNQSLDEDDKDYDY